MLPRLPRKSAALAYALAPVLGVAAVGLAGTQAAPAAVAPLTAPAASQPAGPKLNETVLWGENFDAVPNPVNFTHRMPDGWTVANSGFSSGEERWAGWALTNIREWT